MRSIPPAAWLRGFLLGAGVACAIPGYAAGDQAAYEKARASAKASYEAAAKRCDAMAGNAKDVCVAEAREARAKTEAYAEAAYEERGQ